MIKFTTDNNICKLLLEEYRNIKIVERTDIWEKKNM